MYNVNITNDMPIDGMASTSLLLNEDEVASSVSKEVINLPNFTTPFRKLYSLSSKENIMRTSAEHLVAKWVINRQKTAIRGFY